MNFRCQTIVISCQSAYFGPMAFNGRFIASMIDFAGRQGANASGLYQQAGGQAELNREDSKVEYQQYNRLLEQITAETGDEFFGLHFGESMNMTAAGLVAQITQTSETIKQALQYACDFAQLACSSLPMRLEEKEDHYVLHLDPEPIWANDSPTAVRHTVEGTIVFTIKEFHELTRKQYFPLQLNLPYARPKDQSEYERLFQCPMSFGQKGISIYFEKRHMEERIVTSDYHLLRVLVAHAQERIMAIQRAGGFYEEVKTSVAHLVKPEFPTIEQVACHLHVSVRTLQRRLSEEGHTFKEIIESLRKDFAFAYLKQPDLTINEIAYLLSYTDASAFIRSFRRWQGITPNEFRSQF